MRDNTLAVSSSLHLNRNSLVKQARFSSVFPVCRCQAELNASWCTIRGYRKQKDKFCSQSNYFYDAGGFKKNHQLQGE